MIGTPRTLRVQPFVGSPTDPLIEPGCALERCARGAPGHIIAGCIMNSHSSAGDAAAPIDLVSTMVAAIHAITGATDDASLLAACIESLSSFGYDRFFLSRFCDDACNVLEIVGAWDRGGTPPVPAGTRMSRASSPGIEKILAGDPILYEDCDTDPRIHEVTRRLMVDRLGIRSMALFPLMHRGQVLGSLSANYGAPHVYTAEERQVLTLVAQLAAVTLLGIRSRNQVEERVRLVQALYHASDVLAEIPGEAALLETAARLLVDECGYVMSWIGLVDHERAVLAARAGHGRNYQHDPSLAYPLDNPAITAVAAFHEGRPTVRPNLLERAAAEGWGEVAAKADLRTGIDAPLRAGGESLGILCVGSSADRVTDDEVALVAAFANQLAAAILRARWDLQQAEQMEQLAQAYDRQARLLEVVRELSTPVIPVHDGILVLPLVGTIDSSRSAQIMDALLGAIQREQASVVLIDVTGVPMVDTGVADHLLRVIRAAGLLGARIALVGIAPSVAQTMVALGVDLRGVVTCSDLQAGIAHALRLEGLQIQPIEAGRGRRPPGGRGLPR